MAGERTIKLTFKGDTRGLDQASEKAARSVEQVGSSLDTTGEKADVAETRLIGIHDVVDGVSTVMQGPGKQGMVAYIQGWADVAGGVAGALPLLKALSLASIKTASTQVVQAARTAGAWAVMGAQATVNGARMAAAWFIALGPVGWVIGGLVAVGAAFAVLWRKSETFRNIVTGVWRSVRDATTGAARWIGDKIGGIVRFIASVPGKLAGAGRGMWDWIKDAFKSAVNAVIGWWDSLHFKAPTVHIPGTNLNVGGFEIGLPHITPLAKGGIVTGPLLALLGDNPSRREAVIPLDGNGGLHVTVELTSTDPLLGALLELIDTRVATGTRAAVAAAVAGTGRRRF